MSLWVGWVTEVREQSRGAGDGQAAGLGPAQIMPGVGAEMCAIDAKRSRPAQRQAGGLVPRAPLLLKQHQAMQSSDEPAHSAR